MTRIEAIKMINSKLASLDDERVLDVADIVRSFDAPGAALRELSARELALIQASGEDFRAGRSCSGAEARAATDRFLADFGVAPSQK